MIRSNGRVVLLSVSLILAGCASSGKSTVYDVEPSAVTPVRTTGIETQDIIACGDLLARDLMATPEIANYSGVRIALREVVNASDTRFDAEIISNEIRHRLIRQCSPHIRFVERSRGGNFAEIPSDTGVERALKDEGVVDSTPRKNLAGVDYFLDGEIRSHTVLTPEGIDQTTFIYFKLRDTDSSIIVWEHAYDPIRKVAVKGQLYR